MKNKNDIEKRFLLHYLKYTNKTMLSGKYDLPELHCNTAIYPDFIALFSQKSDYNKTPFTAVAFFQDDNIFDGQHGLYNAIYYNNKRDLKKFKDRFYGLKFAISPDCSECGDIDLIENIIRLKRSRVISLWLNQEMRICVIPLITFPTLAQLEQVLIGLHDCSVVAFSTKGYINNAFERNILVKAIKQTIDTLTLKTIVVYDVCKDNSAVNDIFKYALEKGVKIVIPKNSLKNRNIVLAKERTYKLI